MRKPALILVLALLASAFGRMVSTQEHVALPNKPGSVKFAVLGNSGTGERAQHQLAEQMATFHGRFNFDRVVMVGSNIIGTERPQDYAKKFQVPYKPLLDAGVKFHASLGPGDDPNQRYYKLFNMDGQTYYTFSPSPDVSFFALETNFMAPDQVQWLEQQLQASKAPWKIVFFHHPLYSSGAGEKSHLELRNILEPLLVKYNVAVVLSGQGGFYERLKPQQGIAYFVVGSGGQLKPGGLDKSSAITGKGFDSDQVFLAAEIVGDEMFFMAISREGKIVDAGSVRRR